MKKLSHSDILLKDLFRFGKQDHEVLYPIKKENIDWIESTGESIFNYNRWDIFEGRLLALKKQGANLNSFAYLYVKKRSEELIKFMLEEGVNFNIKTSKGQWLLSKAITKQNVKFLNVFLNSEKADLNVRDENGIGVLFWLARKGNCKEILELLKENKISYLDFVEGKTVLDVIEEKFSKYSDRKKRDAKELVEFVLEKDVEFFLNHNINLSKYENLGHILKNKFSQNIIGKTEKEKTNKNKI